MSRPSAKILNKTAIGRTNDDLIIKQSDGLWVLTYKGEPFQLVKVNRYRDDIGPKYLRTCWPNPQHAHRMAERLNRYFGCDDFAVKCLM